MDTKLITKEKITENIIRRILPKRSAKGIILNIFSRRL